MRAFLLTYYKEWIVIVAYLVLLSIIAIIKFTKNTEDKPLFTCENLFLIFYYIFVAIGPVMAIGKNYKYNFNIYFIFAASLILFIIGADLIIGNKRIKKNESGEQINKKEKNWKIITGNAKIVLFISYAFACIYLVKNLSFILQDLENNRVSAMSGNGAIIYFAYAMLPATWVLYYCHLNNAKVKYMWIYILIDAIFLMLFGFRSRVMELILMCIIIRNDYKKIKIQNLLKAAVILIIVVSLLQVFRTNISSGEAGISSSIINTTSVASINLIYVFNAFPNKVPYQYGYTYLINFQQLLPNYHLDMTMWLKNTLNITFDGGGVTPTVIGEFFMNFGFIGIAIGMLVLGMLCRIIDNIYKNKNGKGNSVIYFIIMFYLARCAAAGISNFIILMLWFIIVSFGIFKFKLKKLEGE